MEKILSKYETMFIVDVSGGEEATAAVVEKFKSLIEANGTVESFDEWGKRRLAYPINDMNDGYYVLVNFEAEPSFVAELERIFNITEGVMRSMTIKAYITQGGVKIWQVLTRLFLSGILRLIRSSSRLLRA